MAEKKKTVGLKLPESFYAILAEEAEQRGESMAGYAEKAVYERFNRDLINPGFDRLPTEHFKHLLKVSHKNRSIKELEKCP